MYNSNKKGGSGLSDSLGHFFTLLAFMGPYMLIAFFFFLSIFTVSAKGIMLILGILAIVPIVNTISPKIVDPEKNICRFFGSGDYFNTPTLSSAIYSYVFIYLLMPMIQMNIMNFGVLTTLICLFALDAVIKLNYKCTNLMGVVFGGLVGIVVAFLYYNIITSTNKDFAFYSEYISDKMACSMPKKQFYRCKMYKNGELLTTFEQGHSHSIDPNDHKHG